MKLNPTSDRAARLAIQRLSAAPEFKHLIQVFRAEAGGDQNYEELIDLLRDEFTKKLIEVTNPLRVPNATDPERYS